MVIIGNNVVCLVFRINYRFNMKTVINISPNFSPLGDGIKVSKRTFPSEFESYLKVDVVLPAYGEVYITIRPNSQQDFIDLVLLSEILDRYHCYKVLVIPYFPFARQDRVTENGGSFSLYAFASLINSLNFTKVTVFDPHSDVVAGVVNSCHVVNNHEFCKKIMGFKNDIWLVSPDAGAEKKIYALAQYINVSNVALGRKHRDTSTGELTGFDVDQKDFKGQDCYVVDDICDGGGTFIGLAKILRERNCGKLFLIVSHGLFTKGIAILDVFDHIFTTDSVCPLKTNKHLSVTKLNHGLLSQ